MLASVCVCVCMCVRLCECVLSSVQLALWLQMDAITAKEKEDLDILFVEAVIDANLAFSITDNPAVKAFFARLRPAYNLPSRWDVSGNTA